MVFNATFNNISVISCHAILLVEETRVPGKNSGLVWFMVFNATFNNISLSYIVMVILIGGGNRSTKKKTTELSQVTDKLYHIMLY
jgi:predicted permease